MKNKRKTSLLLLKSVIIFVCCCCSGLVLGQTMDKCGSEMPVEMIHWLKKHKQKVFQAIRPTIYGEKRKQ